MANRFKSMLLVCTLALTVAFAQPVAAGDVVINEIMYNPVSDLGGDEFIELLNVGALPVDLTDWCLDGVLLCFPAGTAIAPGQFLSL